LSPRKVLVITGKSASLMNVGRDIAMVLQKHDYIPRLFNYVIHYLDAVEIGDSAIFVYPVSPIFSAKVMLAYRDFKLHGGLDRCFYATIEGKVDMKVVQHWMRRDCSFVANSRYTAEKLMEAGFSVEGVVYHGLIPEIVEEARKLAKGYRNRIERDHPDKVTFCVVSTTHKRKGLQYLVEAVKILERKRDDFIVHLLTTKEGSRQIEGSKCLEVIPKYGTRPRTEVLAWIGGHHFMIIPSLAEGFCLPLIEANAMGVPVIHCEYPPLSEISDNSINITFDYEDVDYLDVHEGILYELHLYNPIELARCMEYAIEMYKKDYDNYVKISEKAKEVINKFNAEELYVELTKYIK